MGKFKEKILKFIEDWGKFLAVVMVYVIGTTKYPAEVEVALTNAGIEVKLFGRAVSRAINHNIVAWSRPLFTAALWAVGIVFFIGFIPLMMLAYGKAAVIYLVASTGLFCALLFRHRRSAQVRAIDSFEAFYATGDEVLDEFGPSDRFSAKNFFLFPLAMVAQGFVLFVIVLSLRGIYGTSVIICWPLAIVGFLSIMLGLALFSYVLSATKKLVGAVSNWGEGVASEVAKKVFDWSLLGIDEGNASKLIPPSVVKVADEFFTELEKAGKVFVGFVLPTLSFAGASLSLGLTFAFVVASVFLGGFLYSFVKFGDKKEGEKAQASIAVSRGFLYAVATFFFVVNLILADVYGLHVTPASDGGVQTGFWLARVLARNAFMMMVVTTVLSWVGYRLYHLKLGESLLYLYKVGALILAGFLVLMGYISVGFWTGENITPQNSYFNRFKHTSDEELYCLNGIRDFDETSTDHGPHCSPWRRGTNQPGYRSSAEQPLEIETDDNGGPLRYFTCSRLGWFCISRARAQPPETSQSSTARPTAPPVQGNDQTMVVAMNDVGDESKGMRGHPVTGSGELSPYEPIVAAAHARYPSVPPHFIRSVMWVESRFYQNVGTSSAGANGLMQFMPGTARAYGITDVRDPQQVIPAGAHYLSDLFAQATGNQEDRLCLAAAGYNSGSRGMLSIMRDRADLSELLQACRTGDINRYPPRTKRRYAVTVMSHYRNYLNGIRPDDPSRRQQPSRRPIEEDEPRAIRDLLAQAEPLAVSAEQCSTFTEAYRQMVRAYGLCP